MEGTTDTTDASAPPPPPPAAPRRLTRPRSGRVLGGVAIGVARHLRVDVTLVRVLFVLAAILLQGLGLLAYGLLWLLVPSEDQADHPGRAGATMRGTRGSGFWVGVALVVVGTLWLLSAGGPMGWGLGFPLARDWVLPLVLIGFGVALWVTGDRGGSRPGPDDRPSTGTPASGGSSAVPPPASGVGPSSPAATGRTATEPAVSGPSVTEPAGTDRSEATAAVSSSAGDESAPTEASTAAPDTTGAPVGAEPGAPRAGDLPPPGRPPAPPRGGHGERPPPPVRSRPSPLGRVTAGLALLVGGALWLLRQADLVAIRPVHILAVVLLVIGLGLLVGSWWGRGRLLILAGAVLAPVVLVASVPGLQLPPVPLGASVGQASLAPADEETLESLYQHAAGELTFDLRGLELTDDAATSLEVGAGEVRVLLPEDLSVVVDARASVGELRVLGQHRVGVAPHVRVSEATAGAPTLVLEVHLGAGELRVERAAGEPLSGPGPTDGSGSWVPWRGPDREVER